MVETPDSGLVQVTPARSAAERVRQTLLLPTNPFVVLDVMVRSLLPGFGDPSRRLTSVRKHVAPVVPTGPRLFTREEAAERAGMSADDMERLWRALGFAEPAVDAQGYTEADIEAAAEVAQLAQDGVIDLDLMIGMIRPMGHLVSRLGAAQVSALAGLPAGQDRSRTVTAAPVGADRLVPLLERLVVHAWRRHLGAAASAAMPLGGLDPTTSPKAVGFIDITSYTTLSRRIDWAELASLLERFEECVFDRVTSSGGRVVKTLGDEVLFVASDPGAGAEIALSVMEASRNDPYLPSVHAGIAYGALLERAGDVFGPTVNIASRVTDLARAGAVLVDGSFKHQIEEDRRFRIERRPRRPVRGYASLATYRLKRADARAASPRPAVERAATGRTATRPPASDERPVGERPVAERAATGRTATGRTATGRTAAERPATERPATERPATERTPARAAGATRSATGTRTSAASRSAKPRTPVRRES